MSIKDYVLEYCTDSMNYIKGCSKYGLTNTSSCYVLVYNEMVLLSYNRDTEKFSINQIEIDA